MAATNRPHELDDAALRRFEKRIFIPLPSAQVLPPLPPLSLSLRYNYSVSPSSLPWQARKGVLKKLVSKHNNKLSELQLGRLAQAVDGYSFSDITALAKEAALGPIRGEPTQVVGW